MLRTQAGPDVGGVALSHALGKSAGKANRAQKPWKPGKANKNQKTSAVGILERHFRVPQ